MPTATDPRETLRQVEAELAQQREARVDANKERDEARDTYAGKGQLSTDSDEYRAVQAAVARVGQIDDRIAELQEIQVTVLKSLGQSTPGADRTPAGDPSDPRAAGWDSAALIQDAQLQTQLAHMATSKAQVGAVRLGEVASRDAMVADVTGTSNMRRGEYLGVVSQLRRRLSILDLIPTGTMDNNSLPYTQESGSFDTATEVVEGDLKPEAGLTLTDQTAEAQTIAHWMKIRKQALADSPALQSIVDGRLRYGVLRRLEGQVLAGDGAGTNLRGILNTAGIGVVPFDAALTNTIPDHALRGITTVFLADASATGIVLNPLDWQTALLAKAAGDGHYYSGGPFDVTPQQMWGVPLIPSRAVPQGTALVGDWEIGAMLLIREGVNVLLSDSDGDDFRRNRVTLLAEMRAALPVFRPPAFATVDLAA